MFWEYILFISAKSDESPEIVEKTLLLFESASVHKLNDNKPTKYIFIADVKKIKSGVWTLHYHSVF